MVHPQYCYSWSTNKIVIHCYSCSANKIVIHCYSWSATRLLFIVSPTKLSFIPVNEIAIHCNSWSSHQIVIHCNSWSTHQIVIHPCPHISRVLPDVVFHEGVFLHGVYGDEVPSVLPAHVPGRGPRAPGEQHAVALPEVALITGLGARLWEWVGGGSYDVLVVCKGVLSLCQH